MGPRGISSCTDRAMLRNGSSREISPVVFLGGQDQSFVVDKSPALLGFGFLFAELS